MFMSDDLQVMYFYLFLLAVYLSTANVLFDLSPGQKYGI